MRWRVEKQPGMYPDLIWDDEGDRQHLIAEVHQPEIADQIVANHNNALAKPGAGSGGEGAGAVVEGER